MIGVERNIYEVTNGASMLHVQIENQLATRARNQLASIQSCMYRGTGVKNFIY